MVSHRETPDVQSVARAAGLLEALADAGGTAAVRDLASATGLSAPTVSRLLATLGRAGLVDRDVDGRYALGLGLLALAARVPALAALRRAAAGPLAALRDEVGETASLLVRDGDAALYVDQAESRHVLRLAGWTGRRIPLDGTAAGAVLAGGAVGGAVAADAVEDGVTAIACAIAGAPVPAAIAVAGPSGRLGGAAVPAARRAVERAADDVSHLLSPASRTHPDRRPA